jgi:hypothetical protein
VSHLKVYAAQGEHRIPVKQGRRIRKEKIGDRESKPAVRALVPGEGLAAG